MLIRWRTVLVIAAACAAAVAVAACGGPAAEPTPTPQPTPVPTPTPVPLTEQQVLDRAGEVMGEVVSFHFEMTHEVGTSEFLPGLNVEEVGGVVKVPDSIDVEYNGLFNDIPLRVKLIAIGDANWLTNPLTGSWESVDPAVSPVAFFKPEEGIKAVISSIYEAEFVVPPDGDEYRISGRMPPTAMVALMGQTVEEGFVDVEVWIGADTFLLSKARFSGRVVPLDGDDTVRVVTLWRYDEPTSIEPPPTDP